MSHLRFSLRMGEQWPYGAEYGCSITRFERKSASWAVNVSLAIGFIAAIAACLYT